MTPTNISRWLLDRYQEKTSPKLSSALDFARWMAAFLVLVFHVCSNVFSYDAAKYDFYSGPVGKVFLLLASAGPAAVFWFFVISGYLIGGSVIGQIKRGTFSYRRYALHRAARLYVVLIPALLTGLLWDQLRLGAFGMAAVGAPGMETPDSYSAQTILGNLIYLQRIFVPMAGSNLPLWSLAYEAWFYLMFPLLAAPLMMGGKKPFWRLALLCLLGCALVCGLYLAQPKTGPYFALWLLGAALRFAPRPPPTPQWFNWTAATVITLGVPLYDHLPLAMLAPGLSLAVCLVGAGFDKSPPRPALVKLNTQFAAFSFSLYLVHAPLIHFGLAFAFQRQNPDLGLAPNLFSLGVALALMVAIVVYAWGFARLTEANTDTFRRSVERRFLIRLMPPPRSGA